jgi:FtsZ-binding cell division protein ZapB
VSIHNVEKNLLIATAISVSLSGCAGMSDQETTVAQGAGVGALVGAGIGYAIGGDAPSALIGAATGGLIGASIGSTIAERKAQYANEEDFLIAEIELNEEFIGEAETENRQLQAEIDRLDRESQRLAQEYQAGKASRDALVRQKASLEEQLAKAKKIDALVDKRLTDASSVYNETRQKRGSQDQYAQQLESSVVKLKETRQQSTQNVTNLQQMYDRMSI